MPLLSVVSVSFSYGLHARTPAMLPMDDTMDDSTESAGSEVDTDWRTRRAASVSTGAPGVAAAGLVAVCQPRTGVTILVDGVRAGSHLAIRGRWPARRLARGGIDTEAGRDHWRIPSNTMPPEIAAVPAWPTMRTVAVLLLADRRRMPLILTIEDSPAPWLVAGLNWL